MNEYHIEQMPAWGKGLLNLVVTGIVIAVAAFLINWDQNREIGALDYEHVEDMAYDWDMKPFIAARIADHRISNEEYREIVDRHEQVLLERARRDSENLVREIEVMVRQ